MRRITDIYLSLALGMLSIFSISAFAQGPNNAIVTNVVSRASCPVTLDTPTGRGDIVHLKFRNSSGKTIRGILFGAAYYDATHSAHVIQVLSDEHRTIAVGAVKTGDLNVKYWHQTGYVGWATWPSKILYADGSEWQMTNRSSAACIATYWRDGRIGQTMVASDINFDQPIQLALGSSADPSVESMVSSR